MKLQRRVTLLEGDVAREDNDLDQLLKEGWKVVHMCSFSENVSLNYGGNQALANQSGNGLRRGFGNILRGAYGVVVIVEKETDEK